MGKLALWLVAALGVLAIGCVEAEPDRTNVVIERETPAASTTVIEDNTPEPQGDTDVDINIDASEKDPAEGTE